MNHPYVIGRYNHYRMKKKIVYYYKVLFLIGLIFIFGNQSKGNAQNRNFQIQGILLDSIKRKPVDMALVSVAELDIWSRTDENGQFVLNNIPGGRHTIRFYLLGYKELTVVKEINSDINDWTQMLQPFSLSLKEVNVTATENKLGSISKIENEAIEHIQPKSLTDIFQLLPGQVTENPSLASPGQVKIREISQNANSALGTLIIVDGVRVSNDANMQTFYPARSGNSSSGAAMNPSGTVGKGVDLRDIPGDNIESVEVIKGIPSSEYGNLTSGVVIVKTKIGEQPWTAKAKIDPNTKMGSLYKGLKLSGRSGIVNIGADYAQAYDDIRYHLGGYKRLTGTASYSNTFLNETSPLDVNVRLSYFRSIDEAKSDPQLKRDEKVKSSQRGFRWGIDGKWMLRKPWITNIEYSFSGDYTLAENYTKELQVLSTGAVPYPTSYEEGIFEEVYLPGVFYTEYTTDGRPYNIFGKLKGDWNKQFGHAVNSLKAGLDVSFSGNRGDGLKYDLSKPPMLTIESSIRPRAYKDIPSLKNYAFFMEDKIIQPIGTTEWITQLGIRFSNVQPGNYFSVEPRLNTSYEILNRKNNTLFDRLSVNLGYGLFSKMPTLSYIVPGNAYFDDISFNYLDGDHSLAVVSTKVKDASNPDLKPARSTKKEIGLSFDIQKVSVSLTGFHEKLKNGLAFKSVPYFSSFPKFTVEGAGKTPEFENGQVYYYENGERLPAPYVMDTTIHTYYTPSNNQILIKKGLEYIISIGKIDAIRSSFVIDGAWLYEESYNTLPGYSQTNQSYQGKPYPYIAIMPAGFKDINQRVNTNIRMITHVPELKMVVSLTTQIIWNTKEKVEWEDENGNSLVYYYGSEGERIYENSALEDRKDTRYVDPVAFMDKTGKIYEWDPAYSRDSRYAAMVRNYNVSYYFVEESLPPAVQFNLRLTKEFSRNLTLSFMTNNFLKMNPSQRSNRTSLYVRRNTGFYFGAEINYKF